MSLVLSRKVGEEIVFGDPLNPLGVMKVVEVDRGKIKLAFDFLAHVVIDRREIAEKKRGFPLPSFGNYADPDPAARKARDVA